MAANEKSDDEPVDERDTDPVSLLKKKLDAAIRDERYEEAALLRDEVQKLMGN